MGASRGEELMGAGREAFLPKHNHCNHWKTEITSPVVCLAFWNFHSYFYVNQVLQSHKLHFLTDGERVTERSREKRTPSAQGSPHMAV